MSGVVGGGMQSQQQIQQQQWYKQQQMQQQQQQQNQSTIIQRPNLGNNAMNTMAGPPGYIVQRQRPQQMGGMNQGGYQNVFNADQQQQQQQQQGMKLNQPQQAPGAVSVLSSQLQGGGLQHQVVMGPPGSQHASMQQQMMQNVRSPPPITSPQATPSPRPAPSPRAQPSPHHLPSHSPAPVGDLHNHLGHPHQSPLPAMGDGVMGDSQLNAQEQLSKFVEKL